MEARTYHEHAITCESVRACGPGRGRHLAQLVQHLVGDAPIAFDVRAGDVNVDRRRQTEVEDLGDDVGGQEVEGRPGKLAGQLPPKGPDVVGVGRVHLGGRDLAPDRRFDQVGHPRGLLDTGSRPGAHVQDELPAVRVAFLLNRRRHADVLRRGPPHVPRQDAGASARRDEGQAGSGRGQGSRRVIPTTEGRRRSSPTTTPRELSQQCLLRHPHVQVMDRVDKVTLVRRRFVPQDGEKPLTDSEATSMPRDFLQSALIGRTRQGPVRWDILLTIGEPEDSENDPTIAWPRNRKELKAGP
jgi:hypothetical protein